MTTNERFDDLVAKRQEEERKSCRESFFKWLYTGVDLTRADLVHAVTQCRLLIRGWSDESKFDIDKDYEGWKNRVRKIPEDERPDLLTEDFYTLLDTYHEEYKDWLEAQD